MQAISMKEHRNLKALPIQADALHEQHMLDQIRNPTKKVFKEHSKGSNHSNDT